MAKSNIYYNNQKQGSLPAIPATHQQEGFLLAIPENFLVDTADGTTYNIEVAEVLPRHECVYNLYTTVEDYQHTLAQYVNSDLCKLTPGVSVLVVYYDAELGIYSTLSLRVNLNKVTGNEDVVLEPADSERIVMVFRDFVEYLSTGKFRLE